MARRVKNLEVLGYLIPEKKGICWRDDHCRILQVQIAHKVMGRIYCEINRQLQIAGVSQTAHELYGLRWCAQGRFHSN